MSKKEDAAYQEWLAEIKAKNPDVAPKLDEIADTDAGRELFRGGLREADYYRRLNEISAAKAELEAEAQRQVSWWEQAKPEYESARQERDLAIAKLEAVEHQLKGGEPVDPRSLSQTPVGVPSKELDELRNRVQSMDQAYPQIMLGLFNAQQAAMREGLAFDANQVLQAVYQQKVDPLTAFNKIVAPQREEKAKQMLASELEKAREEGYKQALSKLSGPDKVLRSASPSIVDALRGTAKVMSDPAERRDAAVQDYLEMEASGQL
jgi:hypothetical protein